VTREHAPGVALATKPVRQTKARCGPATLRIVASYYGIVTSERNLAALCRTSSVSGTTAAHMLAAARKLGLSAHVYDGASFRMMAAWLGRGVPVIVDWMSIARRGTALAATGHYSVVTELTPTEIVLEDPAIGQKRRMTKAVFLTLWYDFKYLSPRRHDDLVLRRMLVVAPRDFANNAALSALPI
jgi:ABC-type bacteriocin/lantibiotic exporter with double-glycine peptidase domain